MTYEMSKHVVNTSSLNVYMLCVKWSLMTKIPLPTFYLEKAPFFRLYDDDDDDDEFIFIYRLTK
jgi:hypothetical protein